MFRYDIGTNHTTLNNLAYIPATFLGSSTDDAILQRVCGDSWACMYDYHKTNNQTTAKSTKDADDDFDDTNRGTTPGELVMVGCIIIGGRKQPYCFQNMTQMMEVALENAFWRFWPRLKVQDHMTIRTIWSWTIHNLKEFSKLNMLQDHI